MSKNFLHIPVSKSRKRARYITIKNTFGKGYDAVWFADDYYSFMLAYVAVDKRINTTADINEFRKEHDNLLHFLANRSLKTTAAGLTEHNIIIAASKLTNKPL